MDGGSGQWAQGIALVARHVDQLQAAGHDPAAFETDLYVPTSEPEVRQKFREVNARVQAHYYDIRLTVLDDPETGHMWYFISGPTTEVHGFLVAVGERTGVVCH